MFIGSAAILVGIFTAIAAPAPWAQWAVFAALSVIAMLAFRSRVYQRFHSGLPTVKTGPVGGVITLGAALAAGESCQTEYGGTFWTVKNDSDGADHRG